MKKMVKIKGQSGAAVVEFAVILPVLALLVFGIIEFALLLYNQQVMTNASREGARFGIVSATTRKTIAEIKHEVKEYCNGTEGNGLLVFFNGSNLLTDDDIDVQGAQGVFGEDLTVTVTKNYGFLVLGNLGFDDIPLTGRTVMKME